MKQQDSFFCHRYAAHTDIYPRIIYLPIDIGSHRYAIACKPHSGGNMVALSAPKYD